ncbi:substrate-binding periplasmic protein [Chromobacterium haemolyticum]|uniref:substrate-binding periplasmic protein n=1 Tax=Chromobacterium haemolyticum TaxID=394935 RepID=UPI00196593A2|nr:hypothetical protein [Chromobacterium haemolyticum]
MMRILMLLLCVLALPALGQTFSIRYALVSGEQDPHLPYMQALLQLACSEVKISCELSSALDMNQGRALEQMAHGNASVDLFWGMSSREREQKALPVRIPLYKGLIGWRVPLVSQKRGRLFEKVFTLADLKALTAGQGQDWPDTQILRDAGLPVVASPLYLPLFAMLRQGRFDYFPRSVIEVGQELESDVAKGLTLDPFIVLHYPAVFYFFVSPRRPELARALTQGLEAAVKDGSFDKLFMRFNGPRLRALNLAQRRIIELPNPLLPKETPLKRKELWFYPR